MVRVSVDVPVGVVRLLRDLSSFGGCDVPVKEWAERELVERGIEQATPHLSRVG